MSFKAPSNPSHSLLWVTPFGHSNSHQAGRVFPNPHPPGTAFPWLCSGIPSGSPRGAAPAASVAPTKREESTTNQRQGEIPGLLKADPPLLCFPGKLRIRRALHTPPAPRALLDFSGRKG